MSRRRILVLRCAHPTETDKILGYYELNRSEHVLPRTEAQMREAADRGMLFTLEYRGHMVGVSAVFDLSSGTAGESMTLEVGGTHVMPQFAGYQLQKALFAVRSAWSLYALGPEIDLATVISPANTNSRHNALSYGFVPWLAPTPPFLEECVRCDKPRLPSARCCSEYFVLPHEVHLRRVADLLRETSGTNLVVRTRRIDQSDSIAIDLRLEFLTGSRREALEDTCGFGCTSSPLQPG